MIKEYAKSIFLFRRDLRLEDNSGLLSALAASKKVYPCFILNPKQLKDNPYRGDHLIQFMRGCLEGLHGQLKKKGAGLNVFEGEPTAVLKDLIKSENIEAVFVNKDYTPFSIHRDLQMQHACEKLGCAFHSSGDALLHEPEDIRKHDGGVYSIYTPFLRKAKLMNVGLPRMNKNKHYGVFKSSVSLPKLVQKENKNLLLKGGRKEALNLLKKIKSLKDYDKERNIPYLDKTTHLSAHHKFGTVSIREGYHAVKDAFGEDHTLIQELYWRDFFTHIGYHYPHVLGHAFHEKYDHLSWNRAKKTFEKWCEGRTGFPIVDAGMRQLNATGYMHNRVRMIVASFLVKDLHIDWRWGEKYFAQKLIDYDPLVNNGNWQWAASTGCDAQPYFRIFNPWRQQERFDSDARYIKKWIPELKELPPKDIHRLGEGRKDLFTADYPEPMVDHAESARQAKEMFKQI